MGFRDKSRSCPASGITGYLKNGGTIGMARQIAAHESPRTTSSTTARTMS